MATSHSHSRLPRVPAAVTNGRQSRKTDAQVDTSTAASHDRIGIVHLARWSRAETRRHNRHRRSLCAAVLLGIKSKTGCRAAAAVSQAEVRSRPDEDGTSCGSPSNRRRVGPRIVAPAVDSAAGHQGASVAGSTASRMPQSAGRPLQPALNRRATRFPRPPKVFTAPTANVCADCTGVIRLRQSESPAPMPTTSGTGRLPRRTKSRPRSRRRHLRPQ